MRGVRIPKVPCAPHVNHNHNNHASTASTVPHHKYSLLATTSKIPRKMPLYEIEHSIPLDKSQRDELAQAITHIHTRKFATPSLFVNIRFIDANSQHNYVAGKEVSN